MLSVGEKNDTVTTFILYLHELYLITREGEIEFYTTTFLHTKEIFMLLFF